MFVRIDVEWQSFRLMCEDLARISGRDFAHVLRSEAASCVKHAALESPIASAAQIERAVKTRTNTWSVTRLRYAHIDDDKLVETGFEISVNVSKSKGRVWFAERGWEHPWMVFDAGPSRGWHLPANLWHEYILTAGYRDQWIKERIAELKKRRGIERLSWLQVGDGLAVQLRDVAPGGNLNEEVARAARVRGKVFQNGTATETTNGSRHLVTIRNESPVAIKRRGQSRIDAAVTRRTRNFEIACNVGLFEDLERRAARWPGIFVKPGSN